MDPNKNLSELSILGTEKHGPQIHGLKAVQNGLKKLKLKYLMNNKMMVHSG